MNPLTLVKRIQNINSKEAELGISDEASWHVKYKESAYVFVGGIPFDLTEGDLLAVFAQYGEIVDVNLVRDKGTGKSKGFAFIAYEDQRSTNLAVDNLNGAQVLGRIIRVDHVTNYKKKEEEDEEEERQKREARGVCRAFQRGECTRGAGCRFSHDEQRAANTGWGAAEDKRSSWTHDKFEGSTRSEKKFRTPNRASDLRAGEGFRSSDTDEKKIREMKQLDHGSNGLDGRAAFKNRERNYKEERDRPQTEKRSVRHGTKPDPKDDLDRIHREDRARRGPEERRHHTVTNSRDDCERREAKRSTRHDSESPREDRAERAAENRSGWRETDTGEGKRSRRHDSESPLRETRDDRRTVERSRRHDGGPNIRDDHDRRREKRSRRHDSATPPREETDERAKDRRSVHDKDYSSHHHR